MANKQAKNVNTIKVQLQQKGADGRLVSINPLTLAELVKLQDGTNAETKFNTIGQEIVRVEGKVDAEAGKLAALQGKVGNIETSAEANAEAIATEVARATGEEAAIRGELAQAKNSLQEEINNLRSSISNKNSNTLVYSTMDEFNEAVTSLDPGVGDLVFVLDVKKAFIYKGEDAIASLDLVVPEGWVLFDEISTDVDLVDYLTKAEAKATYRAKADAIIEGDLDGALQGKINSKADLSHVTSEVARVEGAVATVDSRIERAVGALKTELVKNIGAVDAKAIANTQGIATLTSGLQTTDTKVATNASAIAKAKEDITSITEVLNGCVYYSVIE